MEFNQLIQKELLPILKKNEFQLVEETSNILRFKSSLIKLNIVFNQLENSAFIEVGKQTGILFPISDKDIKAFFQLPVSIENVTTENFVQSISILFKSKEFSKILRGDIESFIEHKLLESEIYTSELLIRQTLESANIAWGEKDFIEFIKYLDKIDLKKIPKSYLLKYKIAKERLAN